MGWHPEIPKVGVSMDEVLQSCRIRRQNQGYSSKMVENVFITFFISLFTSMLLFQELLQRVTSRFLLSQKKGFVILQGHL
jgi:hypothetical protein